MSDGTGVRSPRSEDGLFRVRSKDIISCFKFGLQNKFPTKRDTITDDFLLFFLGVWGQGRQLRSNDSQISIVKQHIITNSIKKKTQRNCDENKHDTRYRTR